MKTRMGYLKITKFEKSKFPLNMLPVEPFILNSIDEVLVEGFIEARMGGKKYRGHKVFLLKEVNNG